MTAEGLPKQKTLFRRSIVVVGFEVNQRAMANISRSLSHIFQLITYMLFYSWPKEEENKFSE